MSAAAKPEKRVRNVVHGDAIWRQTINYELASAKNWEKSWGFIRDAYKEEQSAKVLDNSGKLPPIVSKTDPFASGLPSKLLPGIAQDSDNSIISDWISAYNVSKVQLYRFPASKYTYPATTSTEIGWPWGKNSEYGSEENRADNEVDFANRPVKSKYEPKFYTLEKFGGPKPTRNSRWRQGALY